MSDANALNRLRTWESRKFMDVARLLINAECSQFTKNVLYNVGEEFLAAPHERDVNGRLREVAFNLAGGEEAAAKRVIQRMTMYGSVGLGELSVRAARGAGLARAWYQACLHGSTDDLALARCIREEFDSVLESFCKLLGPWEEA